MQGDKSGSMIIRDANDREREREKRVTCTRKKVTTEKKSMRIVSSEPRAKDVRRKPILAEKKRKRENGEARKGMQV